MTPNSESKTKSGCGAVMDKYCIIRWLDSLEDYKVELQRWSKSHLGSQ